MGADPGDRASCGGCRRPRPALRLPGESALIAVDTNILLYAHRAETETHEAALRVLRRWAEGKEPWGMPYPCLVEFIRVATHPQVYRPPTDLLTAVDQLGQLLKSPSLVLLLPGNGAWSSFSGSLLRGRASGNLAYDAAIAAVCREWGVKEILTEDRDFSRFPDLRRLSLHDLE